MCSVRRCGSGQLGSWEKFSCNSLSIKDSLGLLRAVGRKRCHFDLRKHSECVPSQSKPKHRSLNYLATDGVLLPCFTNIARQEVIILATVGSYNKLFIVRQSAPDNWSLVQYLICWYTILVKCRKIWKKERKSEYVVDKLKFTGLRLPQVHKLYACHLNGITCLNLLLSVMLNI